MDPLAEQEKSKYERIWSFPDYRECSPGLRLVDRFLERTSLTPSHLVIDFGVGSGKAAAEIKKRVGCRVVGIDIAKNCLDEGIEIDKLIVGNLWELKEILRALDEFYFWRGYPDPTKVVGYCTDVMEHIPEEKVGLVLDTIRATRCEVVFNIALFHDGFGERLIGEPLHLTVKPKAWWVEKLGSVFRAVVPFGDDNEGLFHCFS